MAAKRFRVRANFPILGKDANQSLTVEGSTWGVVLGKAAREFKKLPVMHRRRINALSLVLEQIESVVEPSVVSPIEGAQAELNIPEAEVAEVAEVVAVTESVIMDDGEEVAVTEAIIIDDVEEVEGDAASDYVEDPI